jgi:hypothetical protein
MELWPCELRPARHVPAFTGASLVAWRFAWVAENYHLDTTQIYTVCTFSIYARARSFTPFHEDHLSVIIELQ